MACHPRIVALALCALVAAATLPVIAPASAHNAPKRCHRPQGKYRGVGHIRAHGQVRCTKARNVARHWYERCYLVGDARCYPGPVRIRVRPGFKCRQEYVPCCEGQGTASLVRCTSRGKRVVHFRAFS